MGHGHVYMLPFFACRENAMYVQRILCCSPIISPTCAITSCALLNNESRNHPGSMAPPRTHPPRPFAGKPAATLLQDPARCAGELLEELSGGARLSLRQIYARRAGSNRGNTAP